MTLGCGRVQIAQGELAAGKAGWVRGPCPRVGGGSPGLSPGTAACSGGRAGEEQLRRRREKRKATRRQTVESQTTKIVEEKARDAHEEGNGEE